MATNGRNRRLEPSFKQHAAVDDLGGVVLDVTVTTGEVNEGQVLESQIDAVAALTGEAILTVTADAVRRGLANRQIQAYLTAAALNLKRLAAVLLAILTALWTRLGTLPQPPAAPSRPNPDALCPLAKLASS